MTDIKAVVQDKFGPAAFNYSKSPIHAKGPDLQWMVEAASLQGHERVLDVACGAGHTSLAFAPHVQQVVASDFTASMLVQVERLAAEQGLTNVETHYADAEALPFESGTFDVVVSRLGAHHWPHPVAALREAARVLRPGGQFILSDAVGLDEPAHDTFMQTCELLRDQSHVRDHTTAQWQAMLNEAGFESSVVRSWDIFVEFVPWIARLATPALNTSMIKKLFDDAPQEVRAKLKVQPDYSFSLYMALFQARLR